MSLIATFLALAFAAAAADSPEAVFKSAIEDFEFGEHAMAAEKLRGILEPPKLSSREDLIVARQYLGACYQMLGDKTKAKAQFSMLLALDPKHKLDPEVFSPALVEYFEEVRREVGIDTAGEVHGDPAAKKKVVESTVKPKDELVLEPRPAKQPPPAALALIPFGVGQFSNHHPVRGSLFAVTEVGLFATSLVTFAMLNSLKLEDDRCPPRGLCVEPQDQSRAGTLQTVYLTTFWSGLGVVAIGVVEALISYPGDALED